MSQHNQITQYMNQKINQLGNVESISPSYLASMISADYGDEKTHPIMSYMAYEHAKSIARKLLANKFSIDATDSRSYSSEQQELFTGILQERYPVRVNKGQDPQYKPLSYLSESDLDWNINQLRKSAKARIAHADALAQYRDDKNKSILINVA